MAGVGWDCVRVRTARRPLARARRGIGSVRVVCGEWGGWMEGNWCAARSAGDGGGEVVTCWGSDGGFGEVRD